MRTRRFLLIGAVVAVAVSSCYPGQIAATPQVATVTTLVDSQAPLREARTFALPDTVIHALVSGGAPTVRSSGDARILDQIRTGFIALGWREVTDVAATRPDVVVLTAVLDQSLTGVAYSDWWSDWSFWPGWPTGFGPDWTWAYPGAPVTFDFDTGTLMITMLDLRHDDVEAQRVPLLWTAVINGVLTSTNLNGVLDGIAQAFVQSPYLERP